MSRFSRTSVASLSYSALCSMSSPPRGSVTPLRWATYSNIERRNSLLWKSPCRYVPRVSPYVLLRAVRQVYLSTRSRLHDERLAHPLAVRHPHVILIGCNLCALASTQETAALHHSSHHLMRGLFPQECRRRLQQPQALRLRCGRLHPVRVQEPLAKHLISRTDAYNRRFYPPRCHDTLAKPSCLQPVQVPPSSSCSRE